MQQEQFENVACLKLPEDTFLELCDRKELNIFRDHCNISIYSVAIFK
jgi:hypothetical protein